MMFIRVPLFLAAFLTSMLIGYRIGGDLNPIHTLIGYHKESIISPEVEIPDNNQFNLLIIGVNDITQPDAELESIWLAAYAENSSKVTFVPIFPLPDKHDRNKILTESFYMENGYPGLQFWDAMRTTNIWWKGFIIIDKPFAIKLIDSIGGIQIHHQKMNGIQAVRSINSWKDDPSSAVEHQKMFIEAVCRKIAKSQTTNLDDVKDLLRENTRLNHQAYSAITWWLDKKNESNLLSCTFPTLTQATFKSTILR